MNAASWKKEADIMAQQAAATLDPQQLEALQLSQLSVNDSSPPQVNYETDNPLAASMS